MEMRFRLQTGIMTSMVDGELVFMDPKKGEYYGLNVSGTFLLETLLELQDVRAVSAKAAVRFDAPAEKIEKDLNELISDLLDRKLLQRV